MANENVNSVMFGESSNTKQSLGLAPNSLAVSRKISGAGFPTFTSEPASITSKY